MGLVLPYHQPWKIVEEIGMLDHLTQGRLEIGTAAGIPQEMAQVGMSVDEARERNDEATAILDAGLAEPVTSHHGKYWDFDGLRLLSRPLQRPWPPKWVTVVSAETASQERRIRRAAPAATADRSVAAIPKPGFSTSRFPGCAGTGSRHAHWQGR